MSGMRLLQLINDILDAAKMKQGGVIIKHQQVGGWGHSYGEAEIMQRRDHQAPAGTVWVDVR